MSDTERRRELRDYGERRRNGGNLDVSGEPFL
jgi:hypothetical protein